MAGKRRAIRRSGCPVNLSLEILGDRWSLLIIRDLMVRGLRTFKEFQHSGEGIATNILADRLRKLAIAGVLGADGQQTDRRSIQYRLTEKGMDLAPVLLDLLIWGARHERSAAPRAVLAHMERNRQAVLDEARRRWRERDPTPLLPAFQRARGFSRRVSRGKSLPADPVTPAPRVKSSPQKRPMKEAQ